MKRTIRASTLTALLLACMAWADEGADRTAIGKVVSSLNSGVPDNSSFTADFDGYSDLARLGVRVSRPHVVISREVWGEATIDLGAAGLPPTPAPEFAIRAIRFVSADVALVDAVNDIPTGSPVLLVMKRDGANWQIASLRRLEREQR